ncbi:11696_t:CDS:2 [Gigaspora rosea]|nr:11696_t:CDS:2 [Gigaspora rosea]
MPETSEPEESESDNDQEETTNDDNNVAILLEDLSAKTDLGVQELSNNIEEYIQMIDQTAVTEDVLTDEKAVEALEKVIRYQEGLDIGKGFDENVLIMLWKKLKEWRYKKDKSKKQTSILSFFNISSTVTMF